MTRPLMLIVLALIALPAWGEQVYVWVDSQGVTHFSQQAPAAPDAATPVIAHPLRPFPAHAGRDPDLKKVWETANALERSRLATERARAEKRAAVQQTPAVVIHNTADTVRYIPVPLAHSSRNHGRQEHYGVRGRFTFSRGDLFGFFKWGRHSSPRKGRGHHHGRHTGIIGDEIQHPRVRAKGRVDISR